MKKSLLMLLSLGTVTASFAADKFVCDIKDDENRIYCKYHTEPAKDSRDYRITWVNPLGEVSRDRIINLPAGHKSFYDYRFIDGRITGTWTVNIYETELEIAQEEFIIKK